MQFSGLSLLWQLQLLANDLCFDYISFLILVSPIFFPFPLWEGKEWANCGCLAAGRRHCTPGLAQHPAGSGYQQDKVFTRPLLAAWHAPRNLWGLQNPTLSLFPWLLWILGMEDDLTNPPKVIDERVLFRKASGLQEGRAARQEPSGRRALAVVLNGTPPLLSEVTPSMGVTNSWKNEHFTCNFKKVPYTWTTGARIIYE